MLIPVHAVLAKLKLVAILRVKLTVGLAVG